MAWTLPPPDPNERAAEPWDELVLAEPTAWFAVGEPGAPARRLADAILALRPGALVVFDTP